MKVTSEDILQYMKSQCISAYIVQSHVLPIIASRFQISEKEVLELMKPLKKSGQINREYISGRCQTICASCYEYGCDMPSIPPQGYWTVK